MGDSRPEGERNFWTGKSAVRGSKLEQNNSPNLQEVKDLRNEGGSDVFTSNRHINNSQQVKNHQ